MAPAPDRLYRLAQQIVDAVVDGYDAAGVALPDDQRVRLAVPGRAYVADGLPAWDCAELAVAVDRVYGHTGDVSIENTATIPGGLDLWPRGALFAVWLVRCAPTMTESGAAPSPERQEGSAETVYRDAVLVWSSIVAAVKDDRIGGIQRRGLAFQNWQGAGPSGGFVGGVTRFRVDLTGWNEPGS